MGAKAFDDPLIDLVREALDGHAAVDARRLFGGAGLYCDGICFALLSRGALYFKVGDPTRERYESEGSQPFGYAIKGRSGALTSYYRVPERLIDEPDLLKTWALDAIEAARNAKAKTSVAAKRPKAKASGNARRPKR